MMGHPSWTLVRVIILILLFAPASLAQELRVGAHQTWMNHDLLGSPRGISIAVGVPVFVGVGLRLGYESYGDEFQSFFSTCAGSITPEDDCPFEPRNEQARVSGLAFAVPVRVLSGEPLQLNLVPTLRRVRIRSDVLGFRTGRTLEAEKEMHGYGIGVEAVAPVSGLPLRFHLSGSVGSLRPNQVVLVDDGYQPFEEEIRHGDIQIGFSLTR